MNFAKLHRLDQRDNLDVLGGSTRSAWIWSYLHPPFNSNRNYSAPIRSQAASAAFKGHLDARRRGRGVVEGRRSPTPSLGVWS